MDTGANSDPKELESHRASAYVRMSTATRAGTPSLTATDIVFSPSSGCRTVTIVVPQMHGNLTRRSFAHYEWPVLFVLGLDTYTYAGDDVRTYSISYLGWAF
jgi:hypothetical protein